MSAGASYEDAERTIRMEETEAKQLKLRERNQHAKQDRKDKALKATVSHDQKMDHSVGVPWRRYSEIRGYGRVVLHVGHRVPHA